MVPGVKDPYPLKKLSILCHSHLRGHFTLLRENSDSFLLSSFGSGFGKLRIRPGIRLSGLPNRKPSVMGSVLFAKINPVQEFISVRFASQYPLNLMTFIEAETLFQPRELPTRYCTAEETSD